MLVLKLECVYDIGDILYVQQSNGGGIVKTKVVGASIAGRVQRRFKKDVKPLEFENYMFLASYIQLSKPVDGMYNYSIKQLQDKVVRYRQAQSNKLEVVEG